MFVVGIFIVIGFSKPMTTATFFEPGPIFVMEGFDFPQTANREFSFSLKDESIGIEYEIDVLKDLDEFPVAYASNITTPVCDDTLCAIMHIELYWDLLGNYAGYDTINGPFTKFDHIEFSDSDYLKLHTLLLDEHSIIRDKEKSDLFDEETYRTSEVVDATTGATTKEIKETVVEGALYSSYTIYHLVYGQISNLIRLDFEKRYADKLQNRMLFSDNPNYQLYALQNLDESEIYEYKSRLLDMVQTSIPLNRFYILKKMSDKMYMTNDIQNSLTTVIGKLDKNSISIILNRMKKNNYITYEAAMNLINEADILSKNQISTLTNLIVENDFDEVEREDFLQAIQISESPFKYSLIEALKAA